MVISSLFHFSLIFSFVLLLTRQVSCEEFSRCYNDVNICLWTDGSVLSQSAAQAACQQRSSSFLPRITSSNIQSKLATFRSAAPSKLLGVNGFWTGVKAAGISSFHWIDESPLAAGGSVNGQSDRWARFAIISYDQNSRQFVFSARRWHRTSSYICQLQQGWSCRPPGDLVMNSKCYKKFLSQQKSWFNASNDCLSRGGSLAVFANIGRPSDNSQLINWLNTSGTDNSYWVGLLRSWWKTTDEDGRSVDVQYNNWQIEYPQNVQDRGSCVIVTQSNKWFPYQCNQPQRYVCQNYTRPVSSTTTTTTTTTSTTVTPIDCPNDIVFVLDESGSINATDFGLMKSFVSRLIGRLDINSGNTRVGLVTFATIVGTAINLNAHASAASLQSVVLSLRQSGGSTHTAVALAYVRTTMLTSAAGDRSNVPNVIVVFTDGRSSEATATGMEASKLKRLTRTKVVALGIGSTSYSRQVELNNIASAPRNRNVILVHDFSSLTNVEEQLRNTSCSAPSTGDGDWCSRDVCNNVLDRLRQLEAGHTNVMSRLTQLQADIQRRAVIQNL